ncbi:MAG TPA: hypothetical protein VER17_10065 [Tepidisphaeraceae bacterium]|nr:hypothetical protein [Tepidisphaeraceae bacterium]
MMIKRSPPRPKRVERLEPRRLMAGGEVDSTFATGGGIAVDFGGDGEVVTQMLPAPDGKLLAFGWVDSGHSLAVARFNANGSLDTTFGTGGKVVTPILAPQADLPGAIAVDMSSGRFASVYSTTATGAPSGVAMFTANGALDTSFSTDGRIQTDALFLTFDKVGFQSDGRLIVAGTGYDADDVAPPAPNAPDPWPAWMRDPVLIRRYNANGAQDTGFGAGTQAATGTTSLNHGHGVHDMEVLPDGRIMLVTDFIDTLPGSQGGGESRGQELYRLAANGQLDAGYGTGGVVAFGTTDGAMSQALDMDVLPDGTAVVLSNEGSLTLSLRKFDAGGDPADGFAASFDRQGRFPQRVGIAAGTGEIFLSDNGSVTRYSAAGLADYTYGFNGIATVPNGATARVNDNGTVLVGGRTAASAGNAGDWSITRLQPGAGGPRRPVLNAKGSLLYTTTNDADAISLGIRARDGRLVVRLGDYAQSFSPSKVKRIAIFALGGNDTVTVGAGVRGTYVDGGDGADTLNGGTGGDVLLGGGGNDRASGNDGDDKILGGAGNDYCLGGAGKDDLFGDEGTDTLSGAGGNDRLFGGDSADKIYGGAGTDSAANDPLDSRDAVETLLG